MLYFLKKKNLNKIATGLAATFAIPFGKRIEKAVGHVISEEPTLYDTKIDAIYNATRIGGPNHRIFDGSHSPVAMWEKIKDTLPDDTRTEEVYNYFVSMIKDMQTVKGIPLNNIENKAAYDKFVGKMSATYGIKKSWFADALTINLSEFFVTTVGVLAFVFQWKKREKEEFADLASSLLTAAAVGANPFLFVASLISLGASYTKSKKKKNFKKGSIRGFLGMGSFFMAAGLFSSPLLGLIFGLCIALTVRRVLKKYSEKEIIDWIKKSYKKNKKIIIAAGTGAGVGFLIGF
jgi:hypothetical protein